MIGRLIAGVAIAAFFGAWTLVMILEGHPGHSLWSGSSALIGVVIAIDSWRERRREQ